MGISAEAVRQRIKRGTLPIEKDSGGSVFVLLDPDMSGDRTRTNTDRTTDMSVDSTPLVEELRDRVRSLETQLSEERTANRENRRLLAAALERIPAIEAGERHAEPPPEARESDLTASEGPESSTAPQEQQGPESRPEQRRSWLYRFFFGP
jgi:hypothetical protein